MECRGCVKYVDTAGDGGIGAMPLGSSMTRVVPWVSSDGSRLAADALDWAASPLSAMGDGFSLAWHTSVLGQSGPMRAWDVVVATSGTVQREGTPRHNGSIVLVSFSSSGRDDGIVTSNHHTGRYRAVLAGGTEPGCGAGVVDGATRRGAGASMTNGGVNMGDASVVGGVVSTVPFTDAGLA